MYNPVDDPDYAFHANSVDQTKMTDQHALGLKHDDEKVRPRLLIEGFPRALTAVAEVSTFGANKYCEGGWKTVPEGEKRYADALYRHLLRAAAGELRDSESGLLHYAHAAWNALAVLQLMLDDLAIAQTRTAPTPTVYHRYPPLPE